MVPSGAPLPEKCCIRVAVVWTDACLRRYRSTRSAQGGAGEPATVIAGLTGVHLMLPEATTVPSVTTVSKAATPDPDRGETVVPATAAPVSETPLVPSAPTPPEVRVRLASVSTSDPIEEHPKPTIRWDGTPD